MRTVSSAGCRKATTPSWGNGGVGLSGGQKQRIALARALAVRPAVLVLDDTTSAVDMETERYIQEQLRNLPFPCTKILIAQRISSVKDADQILVLQDGRIAERGTMKNCSASAAITGKPTPCKTTSRMAPGVKGGVC